MLYHVLLLNLFANLHFRSIFSLKGKGVFPESLWWEVTERWQELWRISRLVRCFPVKPWRACFLFQNVSDKESLPFCGPIIQSTNSLVTSAHIGSLRSAQKTYTCSEESHQIHLRKTINPSEHFIGRKKKNQKIN